MDKIYTESELRKIGMDDMQIKAIIDMQEKQKFMESIPKTKEVNNNVVQIHHTIESNSLVPTSLDQIASYKSGNVVELPTFGDGQPFVARLTRPSMQSLIRSGKIPNSLLNQATSLFANGAGALNASGKNSTNMNEMFEVIDAIVEAALLEPTIKDIRSVGMELTDEQLMAIFSYTQRGVKALEQFRTVGTDT